MLRLAGLFVVVAACGGSGFETGAATITLIMPAVQSAASVSFTGADGAGTMVLGWTINLYSNGPGADCQDQSVSPVASVGIFTNQTADGTNKKATLSTGDVVITSTSPPTVTGTAAAVMGAMGISQIVGTVTVSDFHLKGDGTPDRIDGMLNAGGTDTTTMAGVAITGMFSAPICE